MHMAIEVWMQKIGSNSVILTRFLHDIRISAAWPLLFIEHINENFVILVRFRDWPYTIHLISS